MSKTENSIGTTPVREAHMFDEGRLAEWMTSNVGGYKGPLTVEQFRGGQSNPTYKLVTPDRFYVLRRKPPGQLLKGAHAVEREAKVLSALSSVGFPVAHVHGICVDASVIGTWFYVMEMVEGRIFWDATFPEVSRRERPDYFDAMNETIARLHMVDYEAANLSDFGRPGNYFERQIARWSKQYIEDLDAGRDPHMDRLIEWLPAHIPRGDETSIVHGDFRCDNMIFHPTQPRVAGRARLGAFNAGASFGGLRLSRDDVPYAAVHCRRPCRSRSGSAQHSVRAVLRRSLLPPRRALVYPWLRLYVAFNFFRLAAIFHGIKGRAVRGTAASAHAQERAQWFPELAKLAWIQAQRARN